MAKKKIAVIGVGKIAQDQHLPVIDRGDDFELAATVSGRGVAHGNAPVFKTPAELYAAMPEVKLVSVCTPPGVRHALVREALDAGMDVMMEKPPTTTISELDDLVAYAKAKDRVLFQTWHSQYNAAVDKARDILASDGVKSVRIDWRESVRKWHPGQDWIWEPGGFGVCDPGINALSIFTKIMPFPVFVKSAELNFPANRQTPIDAEIVFKSGQVHQPIMSAGFNWLEENGEVWTISIETVRGDQLKLESGGRILKVNDKIVVEAPSEEYERIYDRFAALLENHESDVQDAPLRLTADAFLMGARNNIEPFEW
ncbi:Gfo/Idh/MocA family oxidoreductase [Devosia rhodophyticola]|uniref:Gfo/Idh/MocA family oxidoreductase n=1 Tax=Devosia rhodophyticola TaxID=3026423 RepID=A0ABY7Z0A3_9HYPH|nr:Gfo/Idh/MocA family oxidoreductase [Devosia rhodophyticola]WDR07019.1 Gfo/Idh/MocA family oxidoreductase [Devosia rhodophyticola]